MSTNKYKVHTVKYKESSFDTRAGNSLQVDYEVEHELDNLDVAIAMYCMRQSQLMETRITVTEPDGQERIPNRGERVRARVFSEAIRASFVVMNDYPLTDITNEERV